MFPVRVFEARIREILDTMDGIFAEQRGEEADDLEELNAELEDALFMLAETDVENENSVEELREELEEFEALCGDYQRLAARVPTLQEPSDRLTRLVEMMTGNL